MTRFPVYVAANLPPENHKQRAIRRQLQGHGGPSAGLLKRHSRPGLSAYWIPQFRQFTGDAKHAFGLRMTVLAIGQEIDFRRSYASVDKVQRCRLPRSTPLEVRCNAVPRQDVTHGPAPNDPALPERIFPHLHAISI